MKQLLYGVFCYVLMERIVDCKKEVFCFLEVKYRIWSLATLPWEHLIILPCLPHTREMNLPLMLRNLGSLLTLLLFAGFISLTLILVRKPYCFNLFYKSFKMEWNQEKGNISVEQPTLRSGVFSIASSGQFPFHFPGQLYGEIGCSTSIVIIAAKAMKQPLKRRSTESSTKSRRFQWRRVDEKIEIKDWFWTTMPVHHRYDCLSSNEGTS